MTEKPKVVAALMLKVPQPGKVKTRLAADLGAEAACEAYRWLAEQTVGQLPAHWRRMVCFSPDEGEPAMRHWLGNHGDYLPQGGGDLGDRQQRAVEAALEQGAGAVVLLGGDCPYLETEVLEELERRLLENDLVVVPACDGGYVALGLRAWKDGLFAGVEWSTERVGEQLLNNAAALGWRVSIMPPLEDIDTLEAWRKVCLTRSK